MTKPKRLQREEMKWRFPQIRGLFLGILVIGIIVFGAYVRVPDFWKLPTASQVLQTFVIWVGFKGIEELYLQA